MTNCDVSKRRGRPKSSEMSTLVIPTTANFTISLYTEKKIPTVHYRTTKSKAKTETQATKWKIISFHLLVGQFPGESGQLARFSLQLFKLYFSALTASKLQEVLNSLNSLLEFNYITSFLLLGILKMFCIPYRSRNPDQLRYPTLFTLLSVTRHEYLST